MVTLGSIYGANPLCQLLFQTLNTYTCISGSQRPSEVGRFCYSHFTDEEMKAKKLAQHLTTSTQWSPDSHLVNLVPASCSQNRHAWNSFSLLSASERPQPRGLPRGPAHPSCRQKLQPQILGLDGIFPE